MLEAGKARVVPVGRACFGRDGVTWLGRWGSCDKSERQSVRSDCASPLSVRLFVPAAVSAERRCVLLQWSPTTSISPPTLHHPPQQLVHCPLLLSRALLGGPAIPDINDNNAFILRLIVPFLGSSLMQTRLMGQYCFVHGRMSSVVVCNSAGRQAGRLPGRARGRSGGRHCTAGQYGYVPLGWPILSLIWFCVTN